MKITFMTTGITRDYQRDIAQAMVDAGLAVEVVPPQPKLPNAVWQVVRGVTDRQLALTVNCSTCKGGQTAIGPDAPKQVFMHCKIHETCPKDIAEQYYRAFKEDAKKPAPPKRDDSAVMRLVETNKRIFDSSSGETEYHLGDPKF